MYKLVYIIAITLFAISCSKVSYDKHDHSAGTNAAGGHGHGAGEIESIRFTEFSAIHELFAEVTPFIRGKEGQFVVHFTKLSDFKPVTTGTLKIVLTGSINKTISADTLTREGIFIIPFTPKAIGKVNILFVYTDGTKTDSIRVKAQKSYSSLAEAQKFSKPTEKGITFLKEESWKIDFASMIVTESNFSETFKATGKLINNPADEVQITASTSGIVDIQNSFLAPGTKVSSGSRLFSLKPGSLREDNFELRYSQAKSNAQRAKKEFDRISELYQSKITTEREFSDAKSEFEKSNAILKNYSEAADGNNISIKAPKAGYIKRLLVNPGQFVEAGTPLAIISNNNKLMIQIDLPFSEYSKLNNISSANLLIGDNTYSMKELNGKFVGTPISSSLSGYVSLYLAIDNKLNLLPNTFINVYLFGKDIPNAITIPKNALWEDQGNYFAFVQKHGELYEKREIVVNGFDGLSYNIATGLNKGDVVVTKGTYRVMLASKSSELPSQTHAH